MKWILSFILLISPLFAAAQSLPATQNLKMTCDLSATLNAYEPVQFIFNKEKCPQLGENLIQATQSSSKLVRTRALQYLKHYNDSPKVIKTLETCIQTSTQCSAQEKSAALLSLRDTQRSEYISNLSNQDLIDSKPIFQMALAKVLLRINPSRLKLVYNKLHPTVKRILSLPKKSSGTY
jgi:hypothetical protein